MVEDDIRYFWHRLKVDDRMRQIQLDKLDFEVTKRQLKDRENDDLLFIDWWNETNQSLQELRKTLIK